MNAFKTMAAAALAIIVTSCSVKEDRTPCPCWLGIHITPSLEHSRDLTVSAWDQDRIFAQTVSVADYPDEYEHTVPKGHVTVAAYCGRRTSAEEGGRIIIPHGCESDPVWAHLSLVDCTGEFARDTVQMCKQWATVHLKIENTSEDRYPYSLAVVSDVCGIDLRDLSPISGPFRYGLELDSDENCSFRLPRQRDDSRAVITVSSDGERLDDLPLYQWIEATGYSWHDRNLKDIYIGVDYVRAEVTIVIQGWAEGESYEITL
jgi:hypothetical protein